jgi:hypothetical protein
MLDVNPIHIYANVGFVVDKVALGRFMSQYFYFPVSLPYQRFIIIRLSTIDVV